MTVNLIDRFLTIKQVSRQKLQLVGVASLLIACKYEEIYPPALKEFVTICDHAYTTTQILDQEADIYLKVISVENMFTSFALYDSCEKVGEYKTTLLGEFNLMNIALSIAALKTYYSLENVLKKIEYIQPVKGRMEVLSLKKNVQVIIDYAHTPDALENVLKTLQQYKNQCK